MNSCVWGGELKDMWIKEMMFVKVLCEFFKIYFLVYVEVCFVRVLIFNF